MRRVLLPTLTVFALSCVVAASASRWVPGLHASLEARRTIEPSLPVTVDLRLAQVTRRPGGGSARIIASIDADPSATGLEIVLRLPPGVSVDHGDLEPGRPLVLDTAGRHLLQASLRVERDADLPIQIETFFRLPDGTPIVSRQGVTLPFGPGRPPGRTHLGAYEMMGVPLQDLAR